MKILTKAGYRVLGFSDSSRALDFIIQNSGNFSLLISDQNMPILSGLELAKEVRKYNKNSPIIICSGHSEGVDISEFNKIGIHKLVSKPISADELLEIVNKLLVRGL